MNRLIAVLLLLACGCGDEPSEEVPTARISIREIRAYQGSVECGREQRINTLLLELQAADLRESDFQIPSRARRSLESKAEWVVDNLDRWRGWSLTGYSVGGLTNGYKPWRLKFGLVSPNFDADRLPSGRDDALRRRLIEEWPYQPKPTGIGIVFEIRF